jgi:hypothetical protein
MLITPNQHAELMLAPRLHLEMMLTQTANLNYQQSVLGVFNLAVALAHQQKKPQIRTQFEAAQRIMSQLILGGRSPSQEENDFLRQSFNLADRHFGIQSGTNLARAFDFVDRTMTSND